MGAVGGLLVRQLESELAEARDELAAIKIAGPVPDTASRVAAPFAKAANIAISEPPRDAPPLVKQPALWFAVTGWAVAIVLLFRRRSI